MHRSPPSVLPQTEVRPPLWDSRIPLSSLTLHHTYQTNESPIICLLFYTKQARLELSTLSLATFPSGWWHLYYIHQFSSFSCHIPVIISDHTEGNIIQYPWHSLPGPITLTPLDVQKLVNAVISPRMDYCNHTHSSYTDSNPNFLTITCNPLTLSLAVTL